MSVPIYYDTDADLSIVQGKRLAFIFANTSGRTCDLTLRWSSLPGIMWRLICSLCRILWMW